MNLSRWWLARLPRERRALVAGVLAIAGTALFLLIEPVYKDHQRLRAELPRLEEDLAWMRQQLALAKVPQRPVRQGRHGQPITAATVEQTIARAGLETHVVKLSPDESGGVRVNFEDVPYVILTDYIYQLREQYDAIITMAKIQSVDKTPGTVDASLLLVSASEVQSAVDTESYADSQQGLH